MGTVKLNNDVRTSVRGGLWEGTPRILLDSFRIVQYFQASRETARFTLVEDRVLAGEIRFRRRKRLVVKQF
jgi:hypothetical protein